MSPQNYARSQSVHYLEGPLYIYYFVKSISTYDCIMLAPEESNLRICFDYSLHDYS